MTKHFLIMALRTLIRNKVYSLINIAGLAISMTCFIFILLWANDELNYNRNHKNIDNIYCLLAPEESTSLPWNISPWHIADILKKEFPQVKQTARSCGIYNILDIEYQNQYFKSTICFADSTLFEIFSFDFMEGNPKEALQKPFSLVVTEKSAKKYFGTVHCLGKQVKVHEQFVFTVTGVIKDVPLNSSFRAELFSNMSYYQKTGRLSTHPDDFNYYTYVQLEPHTTLHLDKKKWELLCKKYGIEQEYDFIIYPYKDLYLKNPCSDNKPITKVKLFLVVGFLILIIACINFINLTSASYLQRTKEIGIRQTLGSSRWALIQRFMSEAFVVCAIAIILSLFLLMILLPYFNQFTLKELNIKHLGFVFYIEIASVFLLTSLISGLYPALYLSRLKPNLVLKSSLSKSNKAFFRKSLIVFQFTISIVLIIATLLINNQLQFMKNKELGFDKTNLCYLSVDSKIGQVKDELKKCSAFQAVSIGDSPHQSGTNTNSINWDGMKESERFYIGLARVDADYQQVMGMKLREGRFLSPNTKTEVVVNEEFAKKLNLKKSVIGTKINLWEKDYWIVGVVKNFQHRSLKEPIKPFLLLPSSTSLIVFRYQANSFPQCQDYITQTFKKLDLKEKPTIGFIDELLKDQYKSEDAQFQLFSLFSGLAILISCLGMIGLSLFETNRRTKEIGVRRVNGASFLQMIVLLNRSFLKWVGIAFIVACPISYYVMNRWLQDFAYRTSLSWWIFALSGLIALVIGLVSTSYQTLRAAKRNPIESLRYE